MKQVLAFLLVFSCMGLRAQDHTEIANLKTGSYEDRTTDIIGLWVVDLVTVGDETLTPTAKWFQFTDKGIQYSGNGWVQNFHGQWRYEQAARQLQVSDLSGQPDEYGPFSVSFDGDQMFWQRTEDGMAVKVSLSPATEKPLAPWDKIIGNWIWESAEEIKEGSENVTISPVNGYRIYFGWDRRYRKFDTTGKRIETGIWHIEPHNPWLWMINDAEDKKVGQSIEFENNRMTFTIKKGQTVQKLYFRKE